MISLVVIIVLALVFDYINGFHDAANSIATIVSTKVLTPFQAVLWAAFFNFAAFFISKYLIGEFKIGNTIDFVITLPEQVTRSGDVNIRCQGQVIRVEPNGDGKSGIAAKIDRYEFQHAAA